MNALYASVYAIGYLTWVFIVVRHQAAHHAWTSTDAAGLAYLGGLLWPLLAPVTLVSKAGRHAGQVKKERIEALEKTLREQRRLLREAGIEP